MSIIVADPNWERWIFASMVDSFLTAFVSTGPDLFVEGTHRELPDDKALFEFRMDAVDTKQPSRGYFVLLAEISVFIQVRLDDDEFGSIRQRSGEIDVWLGNDHCILRVGNGPADDQSFLGNLQYQSRDKLDGVRKGNFGQIDAAVRIEQASVEASFEMTIHKGS